MNKERIYLSLAHLGGREIDFITDAFESNWVTSEGPNVIGFENDLQDYLKNDSYVTALNSGTASIHLGLLLLGVKQGDEVICQSMTFVASANPILYIGAIPVFVDSELETWNICPVALEDAIKDRISKGKKPKAIIAVHLYGMPYKVDEVHLIAKKYNIPVLEDSAEALGSHYKNKKCGTFGEIGVLSFNGNKIITTSSGGAIITKNKDIKNKAMFLSKQALDNATHYEHSEVGYNYRMSNICAGIGRGQMEVLDDHVLLRRKINDFYVSYFSEIKGVNVLTEPNNNFYSNHWLSVITINPELTNGVTREDLRLAFEENNIESRPLWKPLHLQAIFFNNFYYGGEVCKKLFDNGLCLPSGSNLDEIKLGRIKNVLDKVFNK